MALSVVTVALTAIGSLVGVLALFAPPASAQTCDQTGNAIQGNWVITTPQVCSGDYTVDGSISINAPSGSLTLINGGLKFIQDTGHIYSLTVSAGRSLTLDHSIITTEPKAIDPYLQLAFHVNAGTFIMRNHSTLKFPGVFNSTLGSSITITNSLITGH